MSGYTKEEIVLSAILMKNINLHNLVGQQYLDKSFFNEVMEKAFKESKILLYPSGEVYPLITKYRVNLKRADVYIYFMEKDIGFLCVGITIGPHSTFLNKDFKEICKKA